MFLPSQCLKTFLNLKLPPDGLLIFSTSLIIGRRRPRKKEKKEAEGRKEVFEIAAGLLIFPTGK